MYILSKVLHLAQKIDRFFFKLLNNTEMLDVVPRSGSYAVVTRGQEKFRSQTRLSILLEIVREIGLL
jgi:hypothetical protein